jgi:hypothetical protein
MSEQEIDLNLSNSEIDNQISRCLTNLKILGKLKSNNKLNYDENKFSIDEWTYSQPLRRWWSQESRSNTLTHLISFIENLFKVIDSIYSSEFNKEENVNGYYPNVDTAMIFKEENSNILLQFVNEIGNAINGLNNLKHTYKNDTATVSSLEIIIERLDVRSKKIAGILTLTKRE